MFKTIIAIVMFASSISIVEAKTFSNQGQIQENHVDLLKTRQLSNKEMVFINKVPVSSGNIEKEIPKSSNSFSSWQEIINNIIK